MREEYIGWDSMLMCSVGLAGEEYIGWDSMLMCSVGLAGEEYIGESTIFIEDLKRTPSSRQILRLQTQPGSFDYSTGTLTAEVG